MRHGYSSVNGSTSTPLEWRQPRDITASPMLMPRETAIHTAMRVVEWSLRSAFVTGHLENSGPVLSHSRFCFLMLLPGTRHSLLVSLALSRGHWASTSIRICASAIPKGPSGFPKLGRCDPCGTQGANSLIVPTNKRPGRAC